MTVEARTLLARLRTDRAWVEQAARSEGITNLRVTPTGRLLVGAGEGASYLSLSRFLVRLDERLGLNVERASFDPPAVPDWEREEYEQAEAI